MTIGPVCGVPGNAPNEVVDTPWCTDLGFEGEGELAHPLLNAGTTYYIVLDGWGDHPTMPINNCGAFTLSITRIDI
jgi:hypothetical protein